MTSSFRLLLALCLAGLAFVAGLSLGTSGETSSINQNARTVSELDPWTDEEIDALVVRIQDAGLYPDAQIDRSGETEGGNSDVAMTEVEAAFVDPALSALVSSDGDWRLVIYRETEESRTLRLGDTLADDWQVTSISATSVTFERGEETRTLDAYPSREG